MPRLALALALTLPLSGCEPVRELALVQALPSPCAPAVQALRVRGLGDFPPAAADIASLSLGVGQGSAARLELARGTRVITVEGLAGGQTLAFGRTAPLQLPAAWDVAPVIAIAYGPADAFCATADLAYARAQHRATRLRDGSVLLSGGIDRDGLAVTALERYLPTGDAGSPRAAFVPVGIGEEAAAISARGVLGHGATLLDDGRVLVSGGAPPPSPIGAGAFEGVQLLAADGRLEGPARVLAGGPRAYHAALRLPDGRVLLTGGCSGVIDGACAPGARLSTCVLYDPLRDAFVAAPSLMQARAGHDALLRDDGVILVVGGTGEGGVALPPELYDADEARGSTVAGPAGRAAVLPSGLVVALNDAAGAGARLLGWSGRDEAPRALPQLPAARAGATVTVLEDGAILVAGGVDGQTLAASGLLPALDAPLVELQGWGARGHTATLLDDGTVLLAGGDGPRGGAGAAVFLHSIVGPYHTPASLSFDGGLGSVVPSRLELTAARDGELVIEAAGGGASAPGSYAVLAGPTVAGPSDGGFELEVLAAAEAGAQAAFLFGEPAHGEALLVAVAAGEPPRLGLLTRQRAGLLHVEPVPGCEAVDAAAADLPAEGLAILRLRLRAGRVELDAPGGALLRCAAPASTPRRGRIALAALRGRVRFDNLQLER